LKKINLILMIIVLLIAVVNVSALTTNSLDFPRYQITRQNTGVSLGVYGYWNSAQATDPLSISATATALYQPIISDLDNDGTKEYIISKGNSIYFYQISGGSLYIVGQYNLNGTQQGTYTVVYDYNGDGLNELIAIHSNTAYILQFDINSLAKVSVISKTSLPTIPYSAIYCDSEQLANDNVLCWYADNNNSIVEWDMTQYILNTKESTLNDPHTDGVFESSVIVAGQDNNNDVYESAFLFDNITKSQYISGLTFKLNSKVGSPENAHFVYDFLVCPTTKTVLSSADVLTSDCEGTITTLQDNVDISDALKDYSDGDNVYLPFNQEFYVDKAYNYIFILSYVYHNYTNSADYWTAAADYSVTNAHYRQRNIPATNTTYTTNQTIQIYDPLKADDGAGTYDTTRMFAGYTKDNKISTEFLLTFKNNGILQTLNVSIGSITGSPQNNNLTYDIYICPTSASNFGTGGLFDECSQTATKIVENLDVSGPFSSTTGQNQIVLEIKF
jgi:hypothetical protein